MAQAITASRPAVATDDTPDELARFAQKQAERLGAKKPFQSWASLPKWTSAMQIVLRACSTTRMPARQFVRAQVESLVPLIMKGFALKPGMFKGPNADERFKRWMTRRQRMYGDSAVDRTEQRRSAADRREAAARAFGAAYFADGRTRKDAETRAQAMDCDWNAASATDYEKLIALSAGLSSTDVSLPHRVLVPEGQWTWKECREAIRKLVVTGAPAVPSPSLGEGGDELGEFA